MRFVHKSITYYSPELHYNCPTEIITKKVTLPTSVPQITLHWFIMVCEFDCARKKKREENKEHKRLGASKTVPNGRYSSLSLLHIYD